MCFRCKSWSGKKKKNCYCSHRLELLCISPGLLTILAFTCVFHDITKKVASAKAQRQGGPLAFGSKPESDPETSDSEWVDDGESEIDEEEDHNEVANLYSVFLPRHLYPKTAAFNHEKDYEC